MIRKFRNMDLMGINSHNKKRGMKNGFLYLECPNNKFNNRAPSGIAQTLLIKKDEEKEKDKKGENILQYIWQSVHFKWIILRRSRSPKNWENFYLKIFKSILRAYAPLMLHKYLTAQDFYQDLERILAFENIYFRNKNHRKCILKAVWLSTRSLLLEFDRWRAIRKIWIVFEHVKFYIPMIRHQYKKRRLKKAITDLIKNIVETDAYIVLSPKLRFFYTYTLFSYHQQLRLW